MRRLRAVLEDWRPFRTEPFPGTPTTSDERALDALRSLGYADQPGGDRDPNRARRVP